MSKKSSSSSKQTPSTNQIIRKDSNDALSAKNKKNN